jgi:non-ribosomal peptide synthetase component F
MQGVWSSLLHQYTGSNDVVYGVVVSGRPDDLPGVEKRVGMYINTLPLRSVIDKDQNVNDWLKSLQDEQVSSRGYQFTPLHEIQEWTRIHGDLFDSLMVFENYPLSKMIASRQWGLQVGNVQMNEQTNYPLTIVINSTDEISVRFNYNETLLNEGNINAIRNHFEQVLLQIVDKPTTRVNDIKLLTLAEEHQLLFEFNDKEFDKKSESNIIDLFEQQVLKTALATALIFENKTLSYQQLNERSNRLAHYLNSKGVVKETLVPVCVERGFDMIVSILAILKAGGAYVPIDPEYPQERISYMLEDTAASIVLTNQLNLTKNSCIIPA